MAKPRRKKRTHVREDAGSRPGKAGSSNRPPKSMVVRMGAGDVGPSVTQLARDFRAVVEPDTASRLKERRANKLKDYTAMAGPLGVTHLFLFSRSNTGNVHLRIALTPRGPTLTFRIEQYALRKDVALAQKRPRSGGTEYVTAPLLVMNNFASNDENLEPIKKQLESLTTTIFQSMFPPISPQTTPLASIKRILLLNREKKDDGTHIISLRHYAITTRKTGISKRVRRFDAAEQRARERKGGAIPNLGKLDDVADYLLDPNAAGYTSASETELDTDNEIEVTQDVTKRVLSRKEMEKVRSGEKQPGMAKPRSKVEKRAVKLVELGPRMKLRLVKVEEGICEGKVMWNEFVNKNRAEEKELEERHAQRRQQKEARRAEQRANVEKKKETKKNTAQNTGADGAAADDDDDEPEFDSDEAEEILEREAMAGLSDDEIDDAAHSDDEQQSDDEMVE